MKNGKNLTKEDMQLLAIAKERAKDVADCTPGDRMIYLEHALEIIQSVHGLYHVDTADAQMNLAIAMKDSDSSLQRLAIEHMYQAWKIVMCVPPTFDRQKQHWRDVDIMAEIARLDGENFKYWVSASHMWARRTIFDTVNPIYDIDAEKIHETMSRQVDKIVKSSFSANSKQSWTKYRWDLVASKLQEIKGDDQFNKGNFHLALFEYKLSTGILEQQVRPKLALLAPATVTPFTLDAIILKRKIALATFGHELLRNKPMKRKQFLTFLSLNQFESCKELPKDLFYPRFYEAIVAGDQCILQGSYGSEDDLKDAWKKYDEAMEFVSLHQQVEKDVPHRSRGVDDSLQVASRANASLQSEVEELQEKLKTINGKRNPEEVEKAFIKLQIIMESQERSLDVLSNSVNKLRKQPKRDSTNTLSSFCDNEKSEDATRNGTSYWVPATVQSNPTPTVSDDTKNSDLSPFIDHPVASAVVLSNAGEDGSDLEEDDEEEEEEKQVFQDPTTEENVMEEISQESSDDSSGGWSEVQEVHA